MHGLREKFRAGVRLMPALFGFATVLLVVASAAAVSTANVGYDVSYPQCNGVLPSGTFGIAGVNGGLPYSPNPCLGTGDGPSELSWAGVDAGLYANTADPGPTLSKHWPNGQTFPKECNTAANPGADTPECHYDYGWNAASDSYLDAVNAYMSLGWAPVGSTRTPVANEWWLDVESANSWTADPSLNLEALQGERDYLQSVGAAGVGFYSTPGDWQTITGSTTGFSASPSWLAGATSLADAQSRCGGAGFTGGETALVQYPSGGYDADYSCSSQPVLTFGMGAQTLIAGSPSAPLGITLSQAPAASLSVSLTSGSAAGRFATSTSGPWAASLTLPVAAGQTATGSFYYEDTSAGSPILTAAAPGYASATQTETVVAAQLATVAVSPSSAQLTPGESASLSANGADAYGNPVPITPSWSASPALGTFSPNPGNPTTFTASAPGAGTITGTVGSISGAASVTVTAAPDFSLSVTPGTQTVSRGNRTHYAVTITPLNGFSGTAQLSVKGLPPRTAASFIPNPASTTSTLTVSTGSRTARGTYALTVTGVSGPATHTAQVTLVIR